MDRSELSFFLRQVDPIYVAKAYLNKSLKFPKNKIKLSDKILTPDLVVGDNYNSEVFEHTDKNGTKFKIITCNHENWVNETIKPKFICDWCRIEYISQEKNTQEKNEKHKMPVGIPIKIEQDENSKLYFHSVGEYCCFGCAYADLKTKYNTGFYYKNHIYSDSEGLLRYMNYLYTGSDELVASPYWKWHEKWEGKLSDKDFYGNNYSYTNVPNVIIKPAKTSFIRTEKYV